MKLEDCTKEELIYLIKRHAFISLDEAKYDLLSFRSDDAFKKYQEEVSKSIDGIKEYSKVLKPYEGKPILEIPESVIKRADAAYKRYEKYGMASEKHYRRYKEIEKQIDKLLK